MIKGEIKMSKREREKKEYAKKYREQNRDKIRAYKRAWYASHLEHIHEYNKRKYAEDGSKARARSKIYYEANKAQIIAKRRAYAKKYYAAHRDKLIAYGKDYYEKSKLNKTNKED